MKGVRTMFIAAAVMVAIAVLQKTPLAFLPEDGADFVWGLAGGLAIGAAISWLASRES